MAQPQEQEVRQSQAHTAEQEPTQTAVSLDDDVHSNTTGIPMQQNPPNPHWRYFQEWLQNDNDKTPLDNQNLLVRVKNFVADYQEDTYFIDDIRYEAQENGRDFQSEKALTLMGLRYDIIKQYCQHSQQTGLFEQYQQTHDELMTQLKDNKLNTDEQVKNLYQQMMNSTGDLGQYVKQITPKNTTAPATPADNTDEHELMADDELITKAQTASDNIQSPAPSSEVKIEKHEFYDVFDDSPISMMDLENVTPINNQNNDIPMAIVNEPSAVIEPQAEPVVQEPEPPPISDEHEHDGNEPTLAQEPQEPPQMSHDQDQSEPVIDDEQEQVMSFDEPMAGETQTVNEKPSVLNYAKQHNISLTTETVGNLHLPNGLLDQYVTAHQVKDPIEEVQLRRQGYRDVVASVYDLDDTQDEQNVKANKGVQMYELACDTFCEVAEQDLNHPHARNTYQLLTGYDNYPQERQEKRPELSVHSNFMDWDRMLNDFGERLQDIFKEQRQEVNSYLIKGDLSDERINDLTEQKEKITSRMAYVGELMGQEVDLTEEQEQEKEQVNSEIPTPPKSLIEQIKTTDENRKARQDNLNSFYQDYMPEFDRKAKFIDEKYGIKIPFTNAINGLQRDVWVMAEIHERINNQSHKNDEMYQLDVNNLVRVYESFNDPNRVALVDMLSNETAKDQRNVAQAVVGVEGVEALMKNQGIDAPNAFVAKFNERKKELSQNNPYLNAYYAEKQNDNVHEQTQEKAQAHVIDEQAEQEKPKSEPENHGFFGRIFGR